MSIPATRVVESALTLGNRPRDEAVEELLALAGHRRSDLDAARRSLVARLHRRSDDFDATQALQLVERALSSVGWEADVLPELHPTRRHSAPLMARVRRHLLARRASSPSVPQGPQPVIAT